MENIKRSGTALLVAALVATTYGLALFHLGDKPLWIDEGYSWMRTQAAERPLSNDPVHPELYYDLLDVWVGWFGGNEFSLRFPSFLAYAAAIPLVYGIGRIVHSPRAGVLAALLVATSPFVLHYASEARAYALLLFLCSLMFFCLAALLKDRNAWHPMGIALWSLAGGAGWDSMEVKRGLLWVGLIASTMAAMFTHFVALPLPILVASILIVGSLFERGQRWSLLVNVAEMSALVILGWWVCPYGLADLPSWTPPGSNIGPSLPVIERLSRLISIYGAGGHLSFAAFVFGGCAVWGLWHWFRRRAAGRKWIILIVAGCLPGFVYILVTEFLFTPRLQAVPLHLDDNALLRTGGHRTLFAAQTVAVPVGARRFVGVQRIRHGGGLAEQQTTMGYHHGGPIQQGGGGRWGHTLHAGMEKWSRALLLRLGPRPRYVGRQAVLVELER